jgi:thioesterase domain-containing protein/acyl carrier protein
MVPSESVRLGALPLTPNGKVDRKALASYAQERPDVGTPTRAPRDMLEHQLTQIWEDLLGVRPVGLRDNFFELGGHSLLAVNLMDKIENLCGLKLPLVTLFEEATIEHLVKSCLEKLDDAAEPPLVAIHPGGSRRPFFFLHGDYNSGGFYCVNLARHLGPDQPFYVLPSRGGEGCTPALTIEEMASRHLKTLREVQPDGPYLLGGFCHGGLAAFEMSRLLSEQGQKVDLLVLIHASARKARLRRIFRHIIRRVGALVPLTPEQELGALLSLRYFVNGLEESRGGTKLSFVLNKARKALARAAMSLADGFNKRAGGALAGDASEGVSPKSYSRHSAELTLRYYRATHDYVPQKYRGRVTLFWPEEESAGLTDDPTKGWGRVAEEVLVHSVPGNHLTSVTRHHQAVAEQLRVCLQECGAHQSDERSVSSPGAGVLDGEGT